MIDLETKGLSQLNAALLESRVILVAGPRHSGMSTSVSTAVNSTGTLEVVLRPRDLLSREELFAFFVERFSKPDRKLSSMADIIHLLACSGSDGRFTVLVHDTHAFEPSVLELLLELALDSGSPYSDRVRFIFEGSLDLETDNIPAKYPAGSPTAFQSFLLQREWGFANFPKVCRLLSANRSDNKFLAAWLTDVSGGHLGVLRSATSLLPPDEFVSEDTLQGVYRKLLTKAEIRGLINFTATALDEHSAKQVEALCLGKVVAGPPIQILESGLIRELVLQGLVTFHPGLYGYRLTSPVFASLLAEKFSLQIQPYSLEQAIESRLAFLFSYVCAIELHIRESTQSLPDIGKVLAEVNVETQFSSAVKELNRDIARQAELPAEWSSYFKSLLQTHLPTRRSLADSSIQKLTFNELIQVAVKGGAVNSSFRAELERVRDTRNDLAHFRAPAFEGAKHLMDFSKNVIR